jgi:hypothetical protein
MYRNNYKHAPVFNGKVPPGYSHPEKGYGKCKYDPVDCPDSPYCKETYSDGDWDCTTCCLAGSPHQPMPVHPSFYGGVLTGRFHPQKGYSRCAYAPGFCPDYPHCLEWWEDGSWDCNFCCVAYQSPPKGRVRCLIDYNRCPDFPHCIEVWEDGSWKCSNCCVVRQ